MLHESRRTGSVSTLERDDTRTPEGILLILLKYSVKWTHHVLEFGLFYPFSIHFVSVDE